MSGRDTQEGLMQMSVNHCFNILKAFPSREFMIRVNYLEIYNETINDLLYFDDIRNEKEIKLLNDKNNHIVITNAKEHVVQNSEAVFSLLNAGDKKRRVGSTDMNEKSSRAHTLLRIVIESREREEEDDIDKAVRISTLSVVDLAGSECAKMTNAKGERAIEGSHINKSLLTLSKIIAKLSKQQSEPAFALMSSSSPIRTKQHLPYRDSKLTRLLQSALDGDARMAIICTICPSAKCTGESVNTLKFVGPAL